jgi:hypothetical protein
MLDGCRVCVQLQSHLVETPLAELNLNTVLCQLVFTLYLTVILWLLSTFITALYLLYKSTYCDKRRRDTRPTPDLRSPDKPMTILHTRVLRITGTATPTVVYTELHSQTESGTNKIATDRKQEQKIIIHMQHTNFDTVQINRHTTTDITANPLSFPPNNHLCWAWQISARPIEKTKTTKRSKQ